MAARIPLPDEFGGRAFLVNEARDAGVGRSRLAGSDLDKPFWGIRAPVASIADLEALCAALTRRMPPHAFFTHVTAAQLMRFPLPRRLETARPLHVGIAEPGRAMDARGIVGHCLRIAPAELAAWGGLRHTGPVRTWLDLAAGLSLVELVAVGDHIVHREHPLATLHELTDALDRYPSRRGVVRARAALPLLRIGAESPRESALRVIIVLAGLPEPECNVNIYDSQGRFLARGDLSTPSSSSCSNTRGITTARIGPSGAGTSVACRAWRIPAGRCCSSPTTTSATRPSSWSASSAASARAVGPESAPAAAE